MPWARVSIWTGPLRRSARPDSAYGLRRRDRNSRTRWDCPNRDGSRGRRTGLRPNPRGTLHRGAPAIGSAVEASTYPMRPRWHTLRGEHCLMCQPRKACWRSRDAGSVEPAFAEVTNATDPGPSRGERPGAQTPLRAIVGQQSASQPPLDVGQARMPIMDPGRPWRIRTPATGELRSPASRARKGRRMRAASPL